MKREAVVRIPVSAEQAAMALDGHADYQILRRMGPMRRNEIAGVRPGVLSGCALDVETTGLDATNDAIIELALQRFWIDETGRIVSVGRPHSWYEDPGRPIDNAITRLTGISDRQVEGRRIMDPVASSLIADADFVVAHNARFDRAFIDARLPFCAGRPWVCSLNDVDWRAIGFEGRTLGHLLLQMGLFYDAHRASSDVTALLHALDHRLPDGRTVMGAALETAARPSFLIEAVGARFEARSILKGRGYRWDPARRLWSREVSDRDAKDEIEWVRIEVYGGLAGPRSRRLTWHERYSAIH